MIWCLVLGLTKNTKMIRFNFKPSKYHFHNPQISLSSLAIPTIQMTQKWPKRSQWVTHKNLSRKSSTNSEQSYIEKFLFGVRWTLLVPGILVRDRFKNHLMTFQKKYGAWYRWQCLEQVLYWISNLYLFKIVPNSIGTKHLESFHLFYFRKIHD